MPVFVNTVNKDFPGKGEVLIYFTFSDNFKNDKQLQILDQKTNNILFPKLALHEFSGKDDQTVIFELNSFYKYLLVVGLGRKSEFSLVKWRNALASCLRKARLMKAATVATLYFSELGSNFGEIGKHLAMATNLSDYIFDYYKSDTEKKKIFHLQKLDFFTALGKSIKDLNQGIKEGEQIAAGINYARDLVNHPASHQSPDSLASEARTIAKKSKGKISIEVLDRDMCHKLGMGAYLGVAQGSEKEPKFIILHYKPTSKSSAKTVCLIGKSIIFDTGGLSLKPAKSMETMKCDMAGGAAVLGIFQILAELDNTSLPEVYGILPACENMPSGKALRPGDIVTALNGKTIEVLNTDAEGRLTLADALSYAEKFLKPDILIDMATLTGACMVALGTEISGLFGNDERLVNNFKKAANEEGEEIWQLPLFSPYLSAMKSDIADLKNVEGSHYGGTITAALFLKEFVSKSKWAHLDIAGPAFNEKNPKGIVPKGGTGWGVATIIKLLQII